MALLFLLKDESPAREQQGDGDRKPCRGNEKRIADESTAREEDETAHDGARLVKCCSHGWQV